MWPSFTLIWDFMPILVIFKFHKDLLRDLCLFRLSGSFIKIRAKLNRLYYDKVKYGVFRHYRASKSELSKIQAFPRFYDYASFIKIRLILNRLCSGQCQVWYFWHSRASNSDKIFAYPGYLHASIQKALSCPQHWKSMGKIFNAQGQVTQSKSSNFAGNQTHPRFYVCPCYLQVWRRSVKKWRHYCVHIIFWGAQGPVTPKSIVGSGGNSNLSENLCLYCLSATLIKDPIKNKGSFLSTTFSIVSTPSHFPAARWMAFQLPVNRQVGSLWITLLRSKLHRIETAIV